MHQTSYLSFDKVIAGVVYIEQLNSAFAIFRVDVNGHLQGDVCIDLL